MAYAEEEEINVYMDGKEESVPLLGISIKDKSNLEPVANERIRKAVILVELIKLL